MMRNAAVMLSSFVTTVLVLTGYDPYDALRDWIDSISHDDAVASEEWLIDHLIRPGYLILAFVHLIIWLTMRFVIARNRRYGREPSSRQVALSRFICWKSIMWLDFWIMSADPFHVDPVYSGAILIVLIVFVLGTAIDVMIRYLAHYVVRPLWSLYRHDRNRRAVSIPSIEDD